MIRNMKRFLFLNALALGLAVLSSCKKEQQPLSPEAPEVVGTDDASFLLTNLVFTDDDYNITGYMTGFALDEADPGAISIPCESLEKAQELFLSWVPEGSDVSRSDDSITWKMTDGKGVSQGSAVLVAGGDKGAIAHLELPRDFPAVTSVRFLPQSAMPENGELDLFEDLEEFFFLNTVTYGGYVGAESFHGSGDFVVIREYDQDTNTAGIIMFCHQYERNIWWDPLSAGEAKKEMEIARKLDEMRVVASCYRPFMSQIDKALKALPLGDDANDKYLCFKRGDDQQYRFNFREWEPEKVNAFQPTYQMAYIYFFSVEKKKNGDGYRLVFK